MCKEPSSYVLQIRSNIDAVLPKPLSKHARSGPYLLVMSVDVADFTPHACLSTNNIDSRVFGAEFIDVSPFYIALVGSSIPVSEAHVEIGQVVVGEDDLVGTVD